MKNEIVELDKYLDLSDRLEGFEIISFNITYDKEICILALTGYYDKNDPYRTFVDAPNPQYKILIGNENYLEEIVFPKNNLTLHHINKLPNNELLIASARATYYGKDEYEKNAKVFDYQGNLKREFTLGDAIENIQTSKNGDIWVSYYDEGTISPEKIGQHGLVCFDIKGNKLYETNRFGIMDCYALNVETQNITWIYYYTSFPLVRIKNKKEVKIYRNVPVKGFNNFAVWKDSILTERGYSEDNKYHLLMIYEDETIKELKTFQFVDEDGKNITNNFATSRADIILIKNNKKFYKISIRDLL